MAFVAVLLLVQAAVAQTSSVGVALVQFQLSDPNPDRRREALLSIERDPEASQLEPLRASIDAEDDAEIRALKDNLLQLLTISYDADEKSRIEVIQRLSGSIALDVRSAFNPLVATKRQAVLGPVSTEINVAKILEAGSSEFSKDAAYELLVLADLALPKIIEAANLAALTANLIDGKVGDIAVASLNTKHDQTRAQCSLRGVGALRACPRHCF